MSEQQIKKILEALAQQNKATEQQNKAILEIRQEQRVAKETIEELTHKLEPMHEMFSSVSGFNRISVWMLKALLLFGAAIGMVYGFIKFLKS